MFNDFYIKSSNKNRDDLSLKIVIFVIISIVSFDAQITFDQSLDFEKRPQGTF